jgi:hypothetical protein
MSQEVPSSGNKTAAEPEQVIPPIPTPTPDNVKKLRDFYDPKTKGKFWRGYEYIPPEIVKGYAAPPVLAESEPEPDSDLIFVKEPVVTSRRGKSGISLALEGPTVKVTGKTTSQEVKPHSRSEQTAAVEKTGKTTRVAPGEMPRQHTRSEQSQPRRLEQESLNIEIPRYRERDDQSKQTDMEVTLEELNRLLASEDIKHNPAAVEKIKEEQQYLQREINLLTAQRRAQRSAGAMVHRLSDATDIVATRQAAEDKTASIKVRKRKSKKRKKKRKSKKRKNKRKSKKYTKKRK